MSEIWLSVYARDLAEVKRLEHGNPLSTTLPLLLVWLSVYANHPWSVTEPGMPGWKTGAKALCLYSQSPRLQACL